MFNHLLSVYWFFITRHCVSKCLVDNSLMAFQQAELLAQQNLSEAEIEAALEHRVSDHRLHENNGNPSNKKKTFQCLTQWAYG